MRNPDRIDRAITMFATQRKHCAASGAVTYAAILDGFIADIKNNGPTAALLEYWDGAPESLFALRVLGALHRLALDGTAPRLAALFPTAGGQHAPEKVWPVARDCLKDHTAFIAAYTARAPQTNEVARSSVLLGGFLDIAKQFGLPLRLRELGASAGLNLVWDRHHYVTSAFSWGPATAPLTLQAQWDGARPPTDAIVRIADRAGCDRDPIDLRITDDLLRLQSYTWPDQVARMARLRRACDVARSVSFRLDAADAADWIEAELSTPTPGQATVVYHSIFRQYLNPASDAKLQAVMDAAGARATTDAPLAWLAMEFAADASFPDLTLITWPGGTMRALAQAHFHGDWIKWRESKG